MKKNANSLLYTLAMGSSAMLHAPGYNLPVNDRLFLAQSEIIKEIAAKESAVIVGRCADYVLREHKPCLHVFIHTNIKARAERVAKRNDITESEAYDRISKTDRRRANYYNFYTGKKWGEITNYDLTLDSSLLGVEGTAKIIADMAKALAK